MRQLLFATSNPHKVKEVRAIWGALSQSDATGLAGLQIIGLDSLEGSFPEPAEDADTFAGNARLKAVGYAELTGLCCLAEDSGLEVDALGGAPGVHSARYAAQVGSRADKDAANNSKLLREIARIPRDLRTARFVCSMCVAGPSGQVLAEARGVFEGIITDRPRGRNGFGYDPLLYIPELKMTSAELTPEEKNARSHRGSALKSLGGALGELDVVHFSNH